MGFGISDSALVDGESPLTLGWVISTTTIYQVNSSPRRPLMMYQELPVLASGPVLAFRFG